MPINAPQVPLQTLFAELHDVRSLMAELETDSVLVTISLDLPEIGVRGEAVVTGVEPCPMVLPGPGKVVLTTFHHASSHLIDLYLSPQPTTRVNSQANTDLTSTSNSTTHQLNTIQTSEEALLYPQASRSSNMDPSWERIGVTGNHPIWSEDRHDYIATMDLRVGERLKNLSGDTVYVQQKLPRPGPTPVYNLEVQDEHVYYVGTNGVLAHNAGKHCGGSHADMSGPHRRGDGFDSHHMPDRNADPSFSAADGPAIQMDPTDHHATSSNGRHGLAAAIYRAGTAQLIADGKYRTAMAREILDVRRAAQRISGDRTKYNDAIRQMLEYARKSGQLPGK